MTQNILLDYIYRNEPNKLKDAFNSGTDPNTCDNDGWSLLHIACQVGRRDCVEVIVNDPRTNVNLIGPNNTTALSLAQKNHHDDCIDILLRYNRNQMNASNHSYSAATDTETHSETSTTSSFSLQYPSYRSDSGINYDNTTTKSEMQSTSSNMKESAESSSKPGTKDDDIQPSAPPVEHEPS